jgi:hypothetical protein
VPSVKQATIVQETTRESSAQRDIIPLRVEAQHVQYAGAERTLELGHLFVCSAVQESILGLDMHLAIYALQGPTQQLNPGLALIARLASTPLPSQDIVLFVVEEHTQV